MGAVGGERDSCLEADRAAAVAVVIDRPFGLVGAGGERCEFGAGASFGVVEEFAHRRVDRGAAVAGDEDAEASCAGCVGGDLGAEVAAGLVLGADLGEDEREDVGDDLSCCDESHGRHDHSFLEHLSERADARGSPATDIDVVGEVGDVAEELPVGMHGSDQAYVVQVHPTWVRVVGDEHVARAEPIDPVCPDCLGDLLDHRAQMHRLGKPLGHRPQLPVEEGAGEVGTRLDVRRIRTPPQRHDHLVGRRHECITDHLERDRVYDGRHALPSSITTP